MLITRLLLVLEVWNGKPTCSKSLAGNLLVWWDLTLGPLLQGQMRICELKSTKTRFLLVIEVWDGKPTYRKSWAGNLLVLVRFDIEPLVQGQTRIGKLKSAYNFLIIGPRGLGW